ncbi:unnamed protein product [Adineta ricciae]|uniref:Uncharacterized protein n=1 Tax=Adineta ricciae TaxID=249248 RepID=A0A814FGI1_ADIRI|nr:unnamed protein product [Adineta ricciae]
MTTGLYNARAAFFSLPVTNVWPCPTCSFENPLSAYPHCNMCEQAANYNSLHHLSGIERSTSIWQCPQCTLNNETSDDHCTACGYTKQNKPAPVVLINSTATLSSTSLSLAVDDRRHRDEVDAEQIFQYIINYCKKARTNFVDDSFIPSSSSIGTDSFVEISQWLRIADVAPVSSKDRTLPLTIFSSPQPSDIQQGALGNCWLIAALALISEQPSLLQHILLTKEVNKEGVYMVRICHNGLWKTIIVDDCFPCTKHKRLVFSHAKRCQLFVPLIEKACAKVFGSYASLRSGNMREGLQLLTGAPCDHIDLHPPNGILDSDIVWAKLLSACESKLLIGVSTGGTGISRDEYARVHIHGNHAFSILAAHTLANSSSRFVLVRDPHSRSEYREDEVTEAVLKQLRAINPAQRSTGAFWISWSRFLRYFSSITISTYKSSDFDVREAGRFTQSPRDKVLSYRFHIPQKSMIKISLIYHRHTRKTRSFHTQSFVLCDVDNSRSPPIIGTHYHRIVSSRGRFTYWSDALAAGDYVLIPYSISFWGSSDKHRDYTLVIHSSVPLQLTTEVKKGTFLTDCLIGALVGINKRIKTRDAVFYTTSRKSSSFILMVQNQSREKYFDVDIKITEARNIFHSRCSKLPSTMHDSIPPRHSQILFLTEWSDKQRSACAFNYSYSYEHTNRASSPRPTIDRNTGDLHSPRRMS